MAKPIPEGFNSVNAYLIVADSDEALNFYEKAFGATRGSHLKGPGGKGTMHAEMIIGNSTVMLTDENPAWEMKSAKTMGGSPVGLHIYVEDCDAMFERAVAAGCEPKVPLMDAFWGDRYGKVVDPFGFEWGFATHVEDVSDAEMNKRAEAWFASMAEGDGC